MVQPLPPKFCWHRCNAPSRGKSPLDDCKLQSSAGQWGAARRASLLIPGKKEVVELPLATGLKRRLTPGRNIALNPLQAFAGRFRVRRFDVPRETQPLHNPDEIIARIKLSAFDPQLGGMREGVVIAVPVLAKGQQADAGNVVALHGQVYDFPALMAVTMREMSDQPMPDQ